jgi:hypothetical protein
MVQQGAIAALEIALHRRTGYSHLSIREKALYSLSYLAQISSLKPLIATSTILDGINYEFHHGTIEAKTSVLQILMFLHNYYNTETEMKMAIRDELITLCQNSSWKNKNFCLKVICVIFNELADRLWLVEHGIIECIIDVMTTKDQELQEVPLVCLLHLSVHEDIPWNLLTSGIVKIIVQFLYAEDITIRELTVILLKTFLLYNEHEVGRHVPEEKQYMLKRDVYNPQLYGYEYGGLIQDYLQVIVENRREQDYLIRQFTQEEIESLKLSLEDLRFYQNLFMEIDAECHGYLGEDELKMLVVLKGERLDKEEILDLIRKYDLDKSGTLVFKEFVIMMKEWDKEFGKGLERMWKEGIKRGAIGKSIKALGKWWNKSNIQKGQVEIAKEIRRKEKENNRKLEMKFLSNEQFQTRRDKAVKIREYGLEYSDNYGIILPPIKPNFHNF